jgi:GTP diphosphokinase / guanosine-3',5'-bis(diphosphate) 3'-diphosphatase
LQPLAEDQLFTELTTIFAEQHRPEGDATIISEAFAYARIKHEGQFRKNKQNYIVHPVSVAILLAKIPADTATVCAAILHDVLEDTDGTAEEIRSRFGPDVLKIVEGVTKLGQFQFESKLERHAENFRKMFLAMANDVRVVLLKLADRLHNMQTLELMAPEKQVKKARETLDVFAPLANRMGMGKWKVELEDLAFKYSEPQAYAKLLEEVRDNEQDWKTSIESMQEKLNLALQQLQIEGRIYGRVKHYYSIYKKMNQYQKQFHDLYDLGALRMIVHNEKECYEALGLVHSQYKPVPGRFKDYIAMPKSNLYQSLHTTVIGPVGRPIEVQIRTEEMHLIAEYGIAAHWRYKESGESVTAESLEEKKLSWLKQMLEMKEESSDAMEYVENVKLDLFRDEVFVFTPKGDVYDLPLGATPIDFAYRIHTHVGNTTTGSLVNGRIVTLDYQLRNGDIVEIITNKKASPRLDWIKFVQTQHARSCIRQWFKKNFKEEHIEQGKVLLEAELTRAIVDELGKNGKMLEIAVQLNYTKVEDMYLALGYGELSLPRIVNRVRKERQQLQQQKEATAQGKEKDTDILNLVNTTSPNLFQRRKGKKQEEIEGLQGMLYHFAKCCVPLPGDLIVGVITRSRGVMIHRDDCINLSHVDPDRFMTIRWADPVAGENKKTYHATRLEIHVFDRVGIFKDVLTRIAESKTNVSDARVKILDNNTALIEITVDILDIAHLEKIKRDICKISDVISATRAQARSLKTSTPQQPSHESPEG